jgi:multidrug resistance efflux pump
MKRILLTVFLLLNAIVLAQPQTEFIPVTEVPASEQLPAAPLVVAAYAFVWLAFLAYVWVIWRRLGKVEADISTLSAQLAKKRP